MSAATDREECGARRNYFTCTLAAGHEGQHEAHSCWDDRHAGRCPNTGGALPYCWSERVAARDE